MSLSFSVLHGGALGDLALTLSLALRVAQKTDARLAHLLARANPGSMQDGAPAIDRRDFELCGAHWLFSDGDEPAPDVIAQRVTGCVVLSPFGPADATVQRRLASLRPAKLFCLDPRPRPGHRRHITSQWWTQLFANDPPSVDGHWPTWRPPTDMRRAARTVCVHPGAGGRSKCWPINNYVAAGHELQRRGWRVRMLLGPVEAEWWTQPQRDALAHTFETRLDLSADELLREACRATVFLGNDSGPGHLAALVGTPTVSIFGPTSADVWRPLGSRAVVITGDPALDEQTWGVSRSAVVDAVRAAAESG